MDIDVDSSDNLSVGMQGSLMGNAPTQDVDMDTTANGNKTVVPSNSNGMRHESTQSYSETVDPNPAGRMKVSSPQKESHLATSYNAISASITVYHAASVILSILSSNKGKRGLHSQALINTPFVLRNVSFTPAFCSYIPKSSPQDQESEVKESRGLIHYCYLYCTRMSSLLIK